MGAGPGFSFSWPLALAVVGRVGAADLFIDFFDIVGLGWAWHLGKGCEDECGKLT